MPFGRAVARHRGVVHVRLFGASQRMADVSRTPEQRGQGPATSDATEPSSSRIPGRWAVG
jgi:hypothetical protein